MYDLAIIGGGPAGVAAGLYGSRKKLKTVLITESFGGQSAVASQIQNWIGNVSISGRELAENLEKHLRAYADDSVDIKDGEKVELVEEDDGGFLVKTGGGEYRAKTVFVGSGSHRRKLDIPGAKEFENKGISYCASCDGPLFANKNVHVIGGGNSAFETASQLLAYCESVTILNRGSEFRADPITVKKVLQNPKMKSIINARLIEIKGDKFVNSIVYANGESKKKIEIKTDGIFVEIGLIPAVEFLKDLVALDKWNHIIVDPKNQRTSVEGIWAAGDCSNGLYHQNNIAAGDGVKALEDIYLYLRAK
ncbi:MAG: FAD-dependent oxidoreductase [Patescibacteria group bacterium]|nr:FAD-dependent oxidoreductase [Patescibacteria group bacterium]MDE1988511.1 FAD-dependent oxidoreductase [Patescibacteria group bacterium]MDE2217869.1 FAD-dependent oxidoreductase [Patescibacteria group bacterium]